MEKRKRVGRGKGSGHGGHTSGRGHKGAGSRTGSKSRPGFEGGQTPLFRRIPKRGFKNFCRQEYAIVNLEKLNLFPSGEIVNPSKLREKKMVKKNLQIKILSKGKLDHPLTVVSHSFSQKAKEEIEKAGGKIQVISAQQPETKNLKLKTKN